MKILASTFYKRAFTLIALFVMALMLLSCSPRVNVKGGKFLGNKVVSWYGPGFHGKRTASGEVYNMNAMTCAHKSMDFGSRLRIVNPANGRSIVVTVTDRGPFVRGRDIDLSKGAAKKLGMIDQGTARVKVYYIDRDMRYASYIKNGKVKGSSRSVARSSAPSITTSGSYTIQVASFREKSSAVYLKSGLELVHNKVYMKAKWIKGSKYYRVRVGKFNSEIKAFIYAKKLAYEGYPGVKVLTYE